MTSSLLLLVLTLWARSFWRMDIISWARDDGSIRAVASYRGAIHLIRSGTNARQRPAQWDTYRVAAGASYATLHRIGSIQWSYVGFARVATSSTVTVAVPGTNRMIAVAVPPGGTTVLPFGPSAVMELAPWLGMPPYDALIVPFWAIALTAALYPVR